MLTFHIHPTTTQRTYQHCDKVDTWTSKVIFNRHIVSFVIWKNIVNLFIPKWGDINNGENNALDKLNAKLLIVGVLLCYFEDGRSFHLLATMSCRPTTCIGQPYNVVNTHSSTCETFELEDWEPNKHNYSQRKTLLLLELLPPFELNQYLFKWAI